MLENLVSRVQEQHCHPDMSVLASPSLDKMRTEGGDRRIQPAQRFQKFLIFLGHASMPPLQPPARQLARDG